MATDCELIFAAPLCADECCCLYSQRCSVLNILLDSCEVACVGVYILTDIFIFQLSNTFALDVFVMLSLILG